MKLLRGIWSLKEYSISPKQSYLWNTRQLVESNCYVCGDFSEPDIIFCAQCQSVIRNKLCNWYVPPSICPTSGWDSCLSSCYFLSQRFFREDHRDVHRRNPILPCLAEESDFDSSLTQYKCSSGNVQAGGSLWSSLSLSLSLSLSPSPSLSLSLSLGSVCACTLGSALLAAMLLL